MVDMLEKEQLITTDTTQMVKEFLTTSQVPSKPQSVKNLLIDVCYSLLTADSV